MKQHLQPQHFPSHSYKCNNFNHFSVPTRVTRFYCENWRKYERRGMVYMLWKFLLLICHSLFSRVILKSKILEDKKGVKRNVEVLFPRLIIYTKSFFPFSFERKEKWEKIWNEIYIRLPEIVMFVFAVWVIPQLGISIFMLRCLAAREWCQGRTWTPVNLALLHLISFHYDVMLSEVMQFHLTLSCLSNIHHLQKIMIMEYLLLPLSARE